MLKGLDPEEVRLTGVTSLFYKEVPTIGGEGGIPMPAKAIVQKIRHPVSKGLNNIVYAGINMSQINNMIMNPTYILCLG